jgi:DNA-binding transcriptional ArsR family regulator
MSQILSLRKTDLNALSLLFQAMSNDCRLGILNVLRTGPKSVSEISQALHTEQTAISHNLKCLAFCGLVAVQPSGKMRIYSLNMETVEPIIRLCERHVAKYAANLRHCETLAR